MYRTSTAIHRSIGQSEKGHKEVVTFLVEKGARCECTATSNGRDTAPLGSLIWGHKEIVAYLKSKGAK